MMNAPITEQNSAGKAAIKAGEDALAAACAVAGDKTLSPAAQLAQFDAFSQTLLELAIELGGHMQGQAKEDRVEFDRGARAMSSLLRANVLVGGLRDKTARDMERNDEKARQQDSAIGASPAEVERILFETTRHLHSDLSANASAGISEGDEG